MTMIQSRANKIVATQQELNRLLAEAKEERMTRNRAAIHNLTASMTYEEMCEVRDVLNERIREKYASDAIDDE
jgi:F0F1-type ATP synthase membrane subunit b/b'